jgi:hypothetical protein
MCVYIRYTYILNLAPSEGENGILNSASSEGDKSDERGATLQDPSGAAFQVARKIAKLFDQTLQADVEMLYIKEPVFGVSSPGWSAAYGQHIPLSRRTGRRIALAAAYALAIAYRMQQHLLASL